MSATSRPLPPATLATLSLATRIALTVAITNFVLDASPSYAAFNYTDQERAARWRDLQEQIFGARTPRTDDARVQLDAPETAIDAALVPVTVTLADPKDVKALYLIIDDNPSPVAAHFTFGSEADPKTIKLRVRVNHVTNMHAVAEMKDGALIETARLVKAAGGCSAPMGMSDEEAMRGIGQMKLKLAGDVAAGRPVEATLLIRHPNFNGMQMNEAMQVFTPAHYIQTIKVAFDGRQVFRLDTDISLSTNPVLSFGLLPDAGKGDLEVDVEDSKEQRWSKTFPIPSVGN